MAHRKMKLKKKKSKKKQNGHAKAVIVRQLVTGEWLQ